MKSTQLVPKVKYNKIVTILYKSPKEEVLRICIVPEDRPKPQNNGDLIYISHDSPVAKAILNRCVGEEVDVRTIAGTNIIVILQID